MKKKIFALCIFIALVLGAVTVQQSYQQLYIFSADRAASTAITQNGTNLAVSTGVAATGPISGTTGTFSGAVSGASGTIAGALAVDTSTLVADAVNNRVGIGTATPQTTEHIYGSIPRLRLEDSAAGIGAIGRTMHGMELLCGGMNGSTASIGTAIKFMSTDPQFTTENPKLLAGIFPRGTETYGSDTTGGMAIDFATCPNGVGATAIPSVRMTVNQNGYVGIGTTAPTDMMEVVGNVSLASGTYIKLPGGMRDFGMASTAPSSPAAGDRYVTTAGVQYIYNGSAWQCKATRVEGAITSAVLTAASEIPCTTMNVSISASTDITLTQNSTHEVIDTSAAVDGMILVVTNVGVTGNITLPCYTGSNLYSKVSAKAGAATIVLSGSTFANGGATFRYVGSLGRWVQIG